VRKRALISAFPVAVAWLIIFLHAVIPHNHYDEHATGCQSVYHCCHESHANGSEGPDSITEGSDKLNESHDEDGSHFICHYTAGTFHTLDNDMPFMVNKTATAAGPDDKETESLTHYSCPFTGRQQCLPQNHRGPPSLMG
jgi:hypothetical protein